MPVNVQQRFENCFPRWRASTPTVLTILHLLAEFGGLAVPIMLTSSCQWLKTWLAKALVVFYLSVL